MASRRESPVADKGSSDADEGQEVLSLALAAAVQAAEAAQPAHGPFDSSPVPSKAGRGFDSAAGGTGRAVTGADPLSQAAVVILLVRVEFGGSAARGPRLERIGRVPPGTATGGYEQDGGQH